MTDYLVTIGLEVHAQVATTSKMFDMCRADYAGGLPNTRVSVVSLGLPGSLPVVNAGAIAGAALAGLALNCCVNPYSVFARKSYIYPDLPKGYQITQYEEPLCSAGSVTIRTATGEQRPIRIERLHIEEDTGRLVHSGDTSSLIDYNRSGMPLMEIVSEPDMTTPEEARLYFQKLHQILTWIGVNNGNLEEGAMRCDANISLRPVGQRAYGAKVEVKNVNSFRAVERSIAYEIQRQRAALEAGEPIRQETRGWDEDRGMTVGQRSKESAHDYRYFPEPDIPPLYLTDTWIAERQAALPELPDACCARFQADYGLSLQDAELLTSERAIAAYFEQAVQVAPGGSASAKDVANWVVGELFRLLKDTSEPASVLPTRMPPEHIAEVLTLLADNRITRTVAKQVFAESFAHGTNPARLVEAQGLTQISDSDALTTLAAQVIAQHPDPVAQYRKGKTSALQFLVGQMMRATKGQANPQAARAALEAAIEQDA